MTRKITLGHLDISDQGKMYVNDLMGGCADPELTHDLAAAREKRIQLLGGRCSGSSSV